MIWTLYLFVFKVDQASRPFFAACHFHALRLVLGFLHYTFCLNIFSFCVRESVEVGRLRFFDRRMHFIVDFLVCIGFLLIGGLLAVLLRLRDVFDPTYLAYLL